MRSDTTRERRDALLRELDGSGLSMAEFCRRRGLVYGSVAAWRSAARRSKRSAFVEVDPFVPEPAPQPPRARDDAGHRLAAELLLPGGLVLRVFARDQSPAEGGVR